jgi:hypothetical protein
VNEWGEGSNGNKFVEVLSAELGFRAVGVDERELLVKRGGGKFVWEIEDIEEQKNGGVG